MEVKDLQTKIPSYVLNISDVLANAGYQSFLVGGAVRDILLGIEPKDFDIATNALPEQIANLFPKSVTTNARFGTILVIMSGNNGERFDAEVTTFRKEEDYFGGRWPAKVEFASEIETDLSRRDFTINAMALDLSNAFDQGATIDEILTDPFGGQKDLELKVIRAVGNATERFAEDGLRAYKACRLAAELDFEVTQDTFDAIAGSLSVAKQISMERIRDELDKLLKYATKPSVGIELFRKTGLLELFIPELLECIGIDQPEWHTEDVYTHSLTALDLAEDDIRLAALFHDIGKARTRSEDESGVHFYGHDKVGTEMTKEILTRLRYSKAVIKKVTTLIRWHMFYYPSADWRKENQLNGVPHDDGGWTDGAIRRFISNVGEEYIDDLFKLRIADANANPKSEFNPIEIKALQERISDVRSKDMALKVTDLDITGYDLEKLGVEKGPGMGKLLNHLLDEVIDDPGLNNKEMLSELVRRYMDQ